MRVISIILFLSGAAMISCVNEEVIEINEDYLPLRENSGWEYLREYFSTADDSTFLWSDTLKNFIKGDTTFDGIRYKKVVDQYGSVVKVIRKDADKYYGRNHELYMGFTTEYLFLDEGALPGSLWRHYKNDSTSVTEYKVAAVNSIRTFNGVEYRSVMELEVNYYYREGEILQLHYSTLHFYAKGVGEIYAYYPYPASFTYGDLNLSLLKYDRD